MARRSSAAATIVALMLALAAGAEPAASTTTGRSASGLEYTLVVPDAWSASTRRELWLCLHGSGDTHANFRKAFEGIKALADAALLLPQAPSGRWGDADDVRLRETLDEIAKTLAPERTFILGYSAGGYMAYRIGLADRPRFSGILVDAAGLPGEVPPVGEHDLPIYHIHGAIDQKVPLAAGEEAMARLAAAGYRLTRMRVLVNTNHILRPWAVGSGVAWLHAHVGLPPADDAASALAAAEAIVDSDPGRARVLVERARAAAKDDAGLAATCADLLARLDREAEKDARALAKRIAKAKDRAWQEDEDRLRALHDVPVVTGVLDGALADLKAKHEKKAAPLLTKGAAHDASGDYARAIGCYAEIQNECFLAEACREADAKINHYLSDPEIRAKLKVR